MYKFLGKPNEQVMSKLSGKMLFRFDTKGEFFTDDETIAERAKAVYKYEVINIEKTEKKTKK